MGWLVIEGGAGAEDHVRIPGEEGLVCGRGRAADLALPGRTVSRRHARFYQERGTDWVQDLDSRNGTRLNGSPLRGAHTLADGDRLEIGGYRITYHRRSPRGATTLVPALSESASVAGSEPVRRPPDGARDPEPVTRTLRPPAPLLQDTARWSEVKPVARGGMGEVYRAYDRALGVPVAIKRLRPRVAESSSLLRRLHAREAAIGRTIQHPNVVQVLEDGVHAGDPYLLLEWVEGESLERFLRERNAPLGERIEFLRQTALGLAAAHAASVVHADLKPGNILLLAEGQAGTEALNLGILEDPETIAAGPSSSGAGNGLEDGLAAEIARRVGIPPVPDLDHPPFAGREGEMELLGKLADEAREQGELRWVLIYGERGAGKRRLAEEFQRGRRAAGDDLVFLTDGWVAPPAGSRGVWLTLLPPQLPDDPSFTEDVEQARRAEILCEVYLNPFLRGQAVLMVESVVHHPPSARAFVKAVWHETGGNPERLRAVLERSFDAGAWSASGGGYRFRPEVFLPDEREAAALLLERLQAAEKGLRDFLRDTAFLSASHDFETLQAVTRLDGATLYYLIDHALKEGYLVREPGEGYRLASEPFRRRLEGRLDPRRRREIMQRARPVLRRRLAGSSSPQLFAEVAMLEREGGARDRAFRAFLEGALAARGAYDRAAFMECLDEARDDYREAARQGSAARELRRQLEGLLGPACRGLTGLDCLRRLPMDVRVKITDFGISRRLDAGDDPAEGDDGEGAPWGTPRYMSPEQARGEPLGPGSDIYSLGIVARELLEGRHPLGSLKGRPALRAIIDGTAAQLPTDGALPSDLHTLLESMLAPTPAARPAASEVAERLQEIQVRRSLEEYR